MAGDGAIRRARMDATVDPTSALPRQSVARLPTPLDDTPRLAAAAGLDRLWVKREDLTGTAMGGNKLRQLDFLLADALAQGAGTVVATAGAQSNFCRALAGACARLGLGCHLHLRRGGGVSSVPLLQGNLLLDQVFGATVSFTDRTDPWDPGIRAELDGIAAGLREAGAAPHLLQLTGHSAALGVAGWVSGAMELARDFAGLGVVPDTVALACGSGLTLAGLALGFRVLDVPTRVVGISVQQPAARIVPWIVQAAGQAADLLGASARLTEKDVTVLDDLIAPGYGLPSAGSVAAVRLAGRTEGLVLDPVYTGKAMAGLLRHAGTFGRRVVFLHSGGTPGLFHHAEAFADGSPA